MKNKYTVELAKENGYGGITEYPSERKALKAAKNLAYDEQVKQEGYTSVIVGTYDDPDCDEWVYITEFEVR